MLNKISSYDLSIKIYVSEI